MNNTSKVEPQLSVDTHSHDGKWRLVLQKIQSNSLYLGAQRINPQSPQVSVLKSKIAFNPIAVRYFDLVCTGQGNYDTTNQIDALVLLRFLALMPSNEDMYKTLAEQLQDMSTGPCPQGRTTRLAQVINSYL